LSRDSHTNLLLTGSTGFLGAALARQLVDDAHYQLVAATRREAVNLTLGCQSILVGNLDASTDWRLALSGVEVVIHTAARAHIMNDSAQAPLAEFRRVNVEGTLNLARQAVETGVKRFIFISSIKVNGEGESNRVYRFDDSANPEDDYGHSKWEAEQGLKALCSESSMELVVIRPPLVYGPGVKGNLALLCNVIDKGLPLPLGAIRNQRDMLSLNNLIDLIKTCIDHPGAAGQVFLCSDNESVSTPQLIEMMAGARSKTARLWRTPLTLLKLLAHLGGKQAMFQRLSGDFKIDIQHTMDTLDWKPPFTVAQSMQWAFSKKT